MKPTAHCAPQKNTARPWLFILLSSFSGLSYANCDGAAGRLESSEGQVAVERNGQWQPLAIGACLPIDARIQVSGGRAVFRLANETLLRASSATLLRFSAPEEKNWVRLFEGVLHFITRTPHAFDVQTDYVNAGVKGTEFVLAANRAEQYGEVVMLEGEVLASNEHGQQQVRGGETVIARSGQAPRILTVPALRSAVQWTLYFPPLPSSSAPRLQTALAHWYRNDAAGAVATLEKLPQGERDADYFALSAAIDLHRGEIKSARSAIDQALALQPDHSQSLALDSISALTVGHQHEAARLLDRVKNPNDPSVLIARSYLHQAQFELTDALHSAEQAAAIAPQSALVQARLAELLLMTGETKRAKKAADTAIALQPEFPRAHAIDGFVLMQQLQFDDAEAKFKRASELDASDPLPRLGLGLILIRRNHVSAGREQLAIAVALDPGQSLLRSYLGKAYQEEDRESLASDQYSLAKTFDSADPTPWLYSALLAQLQNRPFDALDDLNRSIQLNDNRAVYRSRLQLDADEATRTASQAEIYRELGFDTLAQRTAARAVSTAPSEYGGHRQLAEAYADDPRYDAARASEVLQAQLLQPLSATPILPLLGETNLLALEGAGPSALGFREYNAMFVREKPWLSISGLGGSSNTGAGEITLSGIYDRFSYALSQYHYETQGYRENNDARYDLMSAYTKFQPTENLSFLLQMGKRKEDRGDIAEQFTIDEENDFLRHTQEKKSFLLGANIAASPTLNFIGVASYQDITSEDFTMISADTFSFEDNTQRSEKVSSVEIQSQINATGHWVIGSAWNEIDSDTQTLIAITPLLMDTFYEDPINLDDLARFRSGYAYWTTKPVTPLAVVLGTTYAELDTEDFSKVIKNFSPKLAFEWQINKIANLRTAYYQTLKRPGTAEAAIEPTQLGGLTQVFDEKYGTESSQYALGGDLEAGPHNYFGFEAYSRKITVPLAGLDRPIDMDHTLFKIYWNWAINPSWTMSLNYQHEKSSLAKPGDVFLNTPADLTTQRAPFELSWLSPTDTKITAKITYIDQDGEIFLDENLPSTKVGESFLVTDLEVSQSFSQNRAEILFGLKNLFNSSFKYQNTDIFDDTPRVLPSIPERLFFATVKFSFH